VNGLVTLSVATVVVSLVSLQAQSSPVPPVASLAGTENVKAFIASHIAKGFVSPRTPWGDPLIQGNFTTKDEANTPFERPAEWAGRKMDDITGKEFAEAVAKRQQEAVERLPFAGGGVAEEGVAIAVPIDWFDNLRSQNARPWFVIDPLEGKIPPLRAAAKKRPRPINAAGNPKDADSYLQRSLADRCILYGGPLKTPSIYNDAFQILQTPNYVVFRAEMIHEARIVPIDRGPQAPRPTVFHPGTSYAGEGRGYWDGNTLVVITANFNPETVIRDVKVTPRTRVIERYTRIAPNKVEWTVTLDDPTIWERSWTYSFPMTQDDKYLIVEYACEEGNYGMANLLSAGRAGENKAIRAQSKAK
jgi:hypothetical protein